MMHAARSQSVLERDIPKSLYIYAAAATATGASGASAVECRNCMIRIHNFSGFLPEMPEMAPNSQDSRCGGRNFFFCRWNCDLRALPMFPYFSCRCSPIFLTFTCRDLSGVAADTACIGRRWLGLQWCRLPPLARLGLSQGRGLPLERPIRFGNRRSCWTALACDQL